MDSKGGSSPFSSRTSQERMEMYLTVPEARAIYYRNMVLLLLSLLVGGRMLWVIFNARRHTLYSPVRKFANLMVAILLLIEMAQTIVWIIGVNIAAAVDGAAPWKRISMPRADRWCFPDALLSYWLYLMVFLLHLIMAYFTWAWIVKQHDVDHLSRQFIFSCFIAAIFSSLITIVPILNGNLGLWPHGSCFIRKAWLSKHQPSVDILLARFIILPICWVGVVVLNCYTMLYLRHESRRYYALGSIKRLQVRLLLITTVFVIIWALQSLSFYLEERSFSLEFGAKWAFGTCFFDALIYGYPTAINFFGAYLPLLHFLHSTSSIGRWFSPQREERAEGQPSDRRDPRHRSLSIWETLVRSDVSTGTFRNRRSGFHSWMFSPHRRPVLSKLTPYHIFATTFDMSYHCLPSGGGDSTDSDAALRRGLDSWIPSPSSDGGHYHLYVIAVQRCRVLAKLRHAIHEHLGGPARYVMCGSAEMGDVVYGKMAILVYARTVDCESGAFRLIACNQKAVCLRAVRKCCKGMLGLAFRYYDTAMAVINAHLPATSVYGGSSPLRQKDKHVASMLHSLRIGAGHESWDAHLQYHHVVLLGDLNYRMRMHPAEVLSRVQESSQSCKTIYEIERQQKRERAEWSWRRESYSRLWRPVDMNEKGPKPNSDLNAWDSEIEDIMEMDEHQHGSFSPLSPAQAWSWAKENDILSQRMGEDLLLHSYQEEHITFPPTFKWRSGFSAEDYTEQQVLESAYVTKSKHDMIHKWPPSYPDRIMVRSLPDVIHRRLISAYDMCDQGPVAQISDHRPVSQALTLMIDTSQLPMERLGLTELKTESTSSIPSAHGVSDTAVAMTAAATQRHHGRLLTASQPSAAKVFPLLMTLSFSAFEFHFRGLEVTRDVQRKADEGEAKISDSKASVAHVQDDHTSLQEIMVEPGESVLAPASPDLDQGLELKSCVEEEEKDEKNENKEATDRTKTSLPPRPPSLATNFTSSWYPSSWLPWWPGRSSAEAEGDEALREGTSAQQATSDIAADEDLAFIDHVMILCPLPCEDPLLSLRRAQAAGDFLEAAGRIEQPRSDAAGSSMSSCVPGRPEHAKSRIKLLQNLFIIDWHDSFAQQERLGGIRSSNLTGARSSACTSNRPPVSRNDEARQECDKSSLRIEVLTLGPPRLLQHALIKFVGKAGNDLGQGVICVSDPIMTGGLLSTASHCERKEDTAVRSSDSGRQYQQQPHPSMQGKDRVIRHNIDLSVGGHFKGTVSFDLAVKMKKRKDLEFAATRADFENNVIQKFASKIEVLKPK